MDIRVLEGMVFLPISDTVTTEARFIGEDTTGHIGKERTAASLFPHHLSESAHAALKSCPSVLA
jgi:hypothetical protein